MKILRWGIVIFVIGTGLCANAAAEKFGTFGRDTLLTETPSFSAPTLGTSDQPLIPATDPTPLLPRTPGASATSSTANTGMKIFEPSTLPSVSQLKQPKITVPTFEMPALAGGPQGPGLTMKKKTLLQTIGDELRRYWLLIVLGFVVLLVIYAMHKTPGGAQSSRTSTDQETKKKDIWEKF